MQRRPHRVPKLPKTSTCVSLATVDRNEYKQSIMSHLSHRFSGPCHIPPRTVRGTRCRVIRVRTSSQAMLSRLDQSSQRNGIAWHHIQWIPVCGRSRPLQRHPNINTEKSQLHYPHTVCNFEYFYISFFLLSNVYVAELIAWSPQPLCTGHYLV
jgi:hypothetical protein